MLATTYLLKENNDLYEKNSLQSIMLQALNQTPTHKLRHTHIFKHADSNLQHTICTKYQRSLGTPCSFRVCPPRAASYLSIPSTGTNGEASLIAFIVGVEVGG